MKYGECKLFKFKIAMVDSVERQAKYKKTFYERIFKNKWSFIKVTNTEIISEIKRLESPISLHFDKLEFTYNYHIHVLICI